KSNFQVGQRCRPFLLSEQDATASVSIRGVGWLPLDRQAGQIEGPWQVWIRRLREHPSQVVGDQSHLRIQPVGLFEMKDLGPGVAPEPSVDREGGVNVGPTRP